MSDNGDNELHTKFAEKYISMKDLESQVKQMKAELAVMETALIEKLTSEGLNKISLKGGLTLRVDDKIYPKVSSSEEAVTAIRAAGLEMLLAKENYQAQSLAAYLRECDRNGDPLPEQFTGIIEPNHVYRIIASRH
jgi:hypothetical protein